MFPDFWKTLAVVKILHFPWLTANNMFHKINHPNTNNLIQWPFNSLKNEANEQFFLT